MRAWGEELELVDIGAGPVTIARAFGPLAAAAPAISAFASVASVGMSILGSANQAGGQRQAGDIAYRNALIRNEHAKSEALHLEASAKATEAAGQRQAIEAVRKGGIMASRARAVMAASGAGVDPKLIARLIGEGEYGKDVALFNAGDKARVLRDKGKQALWSGQTGIDLAEVDKRSMNQRADNTLLTGIVGGGLSLASKYGGDVADWFGTKTDGDNYSVLSPEAQVRRDIADEMVA